MLSLILWAALIAVPPADSLDGKVITLVSHHGKYVVAEKDGRARANRDVASDWEQWVVVDHGDGVVSLRSHHGKYLVAELRGKANANRDAIDAWEKWRLIRHSNGKVSFKSHHGTYLVAEHDGELNANRTELDTWEMFELTVIGDTAKPAEAKTSSAASPR